MRKTLLALTLLLLATATPPSFKGTWEGTFARENRNTALTLEIDDDLHGRLLQDGEEFGPISDAKIDGNELTFHVDTIAMKAVLDGDQLKLTINVSHGRTWNVTMTRKSAKGALILAGGGANAPEIMQRFTELAGGPESPIVVIPTADEAKRLTPERLEFLRVRHGEIFKTHDVTVLHTRDRTVADSVEFVKPLQRARGVWIMGGEGGYLLDAYRGTRTAAELKAIVARGGVVGGTSAGAIVLTNDLLSEDGKTRVAGFGLISGVLVWPHWSERHKEKELVKYTAMLGDVVGIGIDEATAVVVRGDACEVIGEGHVGISDGKSYVLHERGYAFDLRKLPRFNAVMSSYGDRFRGDVLVAKNDRVLFRWNNTTEATFRIGSLTKQFTAAAILLLEERGKLSTRDPMRRYLPESPPEWDAVTIDHLLTHTSGIPSDGASHLNFTPGTEFTYSNLGYQLLGRIIERVSGQTYAAFVAESILKPLGMSHTFADPDLLDLGGAGSLRSTTDDLLTWQRALFGGKLLSPASFAKMTTPIRNGYGCALRVVISATGKHVFANEGRVPGWNATLQYYAEDGVVIVVLANLDTQVDGSVARDLGRVAL